MQPQNGDVCICGVPRERIVQTYPAKYNKPDRVLETCWNSGCEYFECTLSPGQLNDRQFMVKHLNLENHS